MHERCCHVIFSKYQSIIRPQTLVLDPVGEYNYTISLSSFNFEFELRYFFILKINIKSKY